MFTLNVEFLQNYNKTCPGELDSPCASDQCGCSRFFHHAAARCMVEPPTLIEPPTLYSKLSLNEGPQLTYSVMAFYLYVDYVLRQVFETSHNVSDVFTVFPLLKHGVEYTERERMRGRMEGSKRWKEGLANGTIPSLTLLEEAQAWAMHHDQPPQGFGTLALFRVMERRIIAGLGILASLDHRESTWNLCESLALTEYTVERSESDQMKKKLEAIPTLVQLRSVVLSRARAVMDEERSKQLS